MKFKQDEKVGKTLEKIKNTFVKSGGSSGGSSPLRLEGQGPAVAIITIYRRH